MFFAGVPVFPAQPPTQLQVESSRLMVSVAAVLVHPAMTLPLTLLLPPELPPLLPPELPPLLPPELPPLLPPELPPELPPLLPPELPPLLPPELPPLELELPGLLDDGLVPQLAMTAPTPKSPNANHLAAFFMAFSRLPPPWRASSVELSKHL